MMEKQNDCYGNTLHLWEFNSSEKGPGFRNPSVPFPSPTHEDNSLSPQNNFSSGSQLPSMVLTKRYINHPILLSQILKPYLIVMSYFIRNVQKMLTILGLQEILITAVSLDLQTHKSVDAV